MRSGQWRRRVNQGMLQAVQLPRTAFSVDEHPARSVQDRTLDTQIVRGHINERPVAHSLDPAAHDNVAGR